MIITTPHNQRQYPRWLVTLLLAGLSMLAPFSIDTYFPAFDAIGRNLHATPLQIQQTLSLYLLGFALMQLLHGALSDAYGRRPVILTSLVLFMIAALGCAFSTSIEMLIGFRLFQGLCAGAGMVVGRAMIRDIFDNVAAQKMMSHVTLIFGLAPAIAPIIGGWLYTFFGWQSVFFFMALISLILLLVCLPYLPESLPHTARTSFRLGPLRRGYRAVLSSHHFLLLSFALSFNFTGIFLYIAASPAFVQQILGLGPTQFAWLFIPCIAGFMIGAYLSGHTAGKITPERSVFWGYMIMGCAVAINLIYNFTVIRLALPWAVLPILIYTTGLALASPSMTLIVLDLFPRSRGMAASLQGFVSTLINSLSSGLLVPLLAFSGQALAMGLAGLYGAGALCWLIYRQVYLREQKQQPIQEPAV